MLLLLLPLLFLLPLLPHLASSAFCLPSKLLAEVGQDEQAEESVISSVFCALPTLTQHQCLHTSWQGYHSSVHTSMPGYYSVQHTFVEECQCVESMQGHTWHYANKAYYLQSHIQSNAFSCSMPWPPKSVPSSMISLLS